MANISATASTAQSNKPAPGPIPGEYTIYGEYTTTASISVGDTIHMVRVPMGMRITDVAVQVTGNPAGSQLHVDVGDHGAADRFMDSLSVGDGTVKRMNNGLGYLYEAASSTQVDTIDLRPTAAASNTATMTIKMTVKGFIDG